MLARVLLAQDRPGPALALLERLHAAAAAQDRTGSVIEIQALQALALAAGGDEDAAVDTLAEALTLGCPQGYVRVFADEGRRWPRCWPGWSRPRRQTTRAARGSRSAAWPGCCGRSAASLLRRAPGGRRGGAGPGRAADRPRAGGAGLLAAGTPNPRIAEELVVSLDTVKKHVSHLLGKLGAANRTEAVTRARQLGLIP